MQEALVKRTQDLSEFNKSWCDDFPKVFDDYSALKISLGKLTEFKQEVLSMEETPNMRQVLVRHLQIWLEEANNARKLLNHALQVQDWLVARTKHDAKIDEVQAKLNQNPLPKPSQEADTNAKADFDDELKERAKLESELGQLQKYKVDYYRSAPSDKLQHSEMKNFRPLDQFNIKPCPNESQPSKGILYVSNGANGQSSRFLAINDWSDYDIALQEAQRLKASLVADTTLIKP